MFNPWIYHFFLNIFPVDENIINNLTIMMSNLIPRSRLAWKTFLVRSTYFLVASAELNASTLNLSKLGFFLKLAIRKLNYSENVINAGSPRFTKRIEFDSNISEFLGRWLIKFHFLLTVAQFLVHRIVEILRRVRIRSRAAAHENTSSSLFHVEHLMDNKKKTKNCFKQKEVFFFTVFVLIVQRCEKVW